MHEAHDALARKLLYAKTDDFDYVTSSEGVFSHVYLVADSMQFDYDLKRVWVPPSRWTTMVRQYVDPDALTRWLDTVASRTGRPRADRIIFRTNEVQPRSGGKGTVRNLGSCMLTISIGFEPRPQVMLHSRTCYIGYLSPLDMAVAYHIGRMGAKVAASKNQYPIEEFEFVWFLETAQFHDFRTIAFALGDETERHRFDRHAPAWDDKSRVALWRAHKHRNLWEDQNNEGVKYEDMRAFRSYQRLRKRYNTELFGYNFAKQFATPDNTAFPVLPSTPVTSLTFEKIGMS